MHGHISDTFRKHFSPSVDLILPVTIPCPKLLSDWHTAFALAPSGVEVVLQGVVGWLSKSRNLHTFHHTIDVLYMHSSKSLPGSSGLICLELVRILASNGRALLTRLNYGLDRFDRSANLPTSKTLTRSSQWTSWGFRLPTSFRDIFSGFYGVFPPLFRIQRKVKS